METARRSNPNCPDPPPIPKASARELLGKAEKHLARASTKHPRGCACASCAALRHIRRSLRWLDFSLHQAPRPVGMPAVVRRTMQPCFRK
jgi:hypothetical protein